MAKLEDLVTPSEILDVMKDGAVKVDLIKRFKTSDADLAKMLLPLYRSGRLTKEEFNNFFQGLPISHEEPSPEPLAAVPIPKEEEPTPETPEQASTAVPEAPPIETEELPEAAPEVFSAQTLSTDEGVPPATWGSLVPDSAEEEGMLPSGILEMILARLSSIDKRLSEIEKKLGSM